MKISVQKGRKQIIVLDWGQPPFGFEETKRGLAMIPHGFTAETCADKQTWIASTRVIDGAPEYKFTLKDDPSLASSDWRRNPTAAYRQANERLGNPHYRTGTNAAVIIGCIYPNLQQEILARFGECGSSRTKRPRLAGGEVTEPKQSVPCKSESSVKPGVNNGDDIVDQSGAPSEVKTLQKFIPQSSAEAALRPTLVPSTKMNIDFDLDDCDLFNLLFDSECSCAANAG